MTRYVKEGRCLHAGGSAGSVACLLGQVATEFGFAPLAIGDGMGHLRRLAAADAELRAMGATCSFYAPLLALDAAPGVPAAPATPAAPLADWCAG